LLPEQPLAHGEPRQTSDPFDTFWSLAVRKTGKGAARTAFARALTRVDLHTLAQAWVAANRAWATWPDPTKVPHPSTWLTQERWADDPVVPHVGKTVGQLLRSEITDEMRRIL
jgi:hypothetical protein